MDKRNILLAAATAALALYAAAFPLMEETPTAAALAVQEAADPDKPSAADLWSDDGSLHRIKPLDVDLDAETQWAILETCGHDSGLFCFVLAIAEQESGFDPHKTGDDGDSLGMMQINTRWHTGRMETLGVTDLTNPVQCAAVAVDYLQELESRYGFEPESSGILMAYNAGPSSAKNDIKAGKTATDYSRKVMTVYHGYLEDIRLDESRPRC